MVGILVKKQFLEIFRGFFYNSKTNRSHPAKRTLMRFVLYGILLVLILGGIFAKMASSLCAPLIAAHMGWLYFALTGLFAIFMGVIGSVFNTSSGLFYAKDNELLLAMPIPVKTILFARLLTVYLMDVMFSVLVAVPVVIVYCITAPFSAKTLFGGIFFTLLVTWFALFLSCLLGWVVAQIGRKLKNSAITKALIAILCIGLYYVLYFKAINLIKDIAQNAAMYGEQLSTSAKFLVFFGLSGEGDLMSIGILTGIIALLLGLVWILLKKSFFKLALDTGSGSKVKYREKRAKERGIFSALLAKEFGRFKSSSNYMLNCGLGTVFILAFGIVLLIKGRDLLNMIGTMLTGKAGYGAMLICAILCMVSTMNDSAAPSVSLEGKSLWILQSSPVVTKKILWAKIATQWIITGIPMLFASVCGVIVYRGSFGESLMMILFPLIFVCLNAIWGLFLGLQWPNLTWTSEIVPIKQSMAVAIAILGGWVIVFLFTGLYFLFAWQIGIVIYLVILGVIMGVASFIFRNWINHQGVEIFSKL